MDDLTVDLGIDYRSAVKHVYTNIQREDILPSEKAKAYKKIVFAEAAEIIL